MDLFGTKAKREALNMAIESLDWRLKHNMLLMKWNALISRINALGGEALFANAERHKNAPASPFTREEINFLVRTAHPDRNGNDAIATSVTQKLLSMRTKQ